MGYTTRFVGTIMLDNPLTTEQAAELRAFSEDGPQKVIAKDGKPLEGYCQWIPDEDGAGIMWDGGEKFYNHVEWLEVIIAKFLEPWGYTLEGAIEWQGDSTGDVGVLAVSRNVITTHPRVTLDTMPSDVEIKTVDDALDAVQSLIDFAAGPKLVCVKQAAERARGSKIGMPCLRSVNPSWGRPLTKTEYAKLCAACLCYWHLSAARNDLDAAKKAAGGT